MNNVGFRVNLNDYLSDVGKLDDFFNIYFSKFSIMEIKVNDSLVYSKYLNHILYFIQKRDVSFHIGKDFLNNPREIDLKIINAISNGRKFFLVTHIPETYSRMNIEKALMSLPNNCELLFENPNQFKCEKYLSLIIDFYKLIDDYEQMAFCLDLGHLLFNQYFNEKKDYLLSLTSNVNFGKFLEFHVHDYNKKGDHKKIGTGLIDLKDINTLIGEYLKLSRLIIESNVDNYDLSDGEFQKKIVLQNLLR